MARIFITGSAARIGQLSATALIEQRNKAVLHARDAGRGDDAIKKNPKAETVLTGHGLNLQKAKNPSPEAEELGTFGTVIHNAGVYRASAKDIFAVNTLAPYILTCLMQKPKR